MEEPSDKALIAGLQNLAISLLYKNFCLWSLFLGLTLSLDKAK